MEHNNLQKSKTVAQIKQRKAPQYKRNKKIHVWITTNEVKSTFGLVHEYASLYTSVISRAQRD